MKCKKILNCHLKFYLIMLGFIKYIMLYVKSKCSIYRSLSVNKLANLQHWWCPRVVSTSGVWLWANELNLQHTQQNQPIDLLITNEEQIH